MDDDTPKPPPPKEEPKPRKGMDADSTLGKVLEYVTSPFRLFAVVVMGVLSFSGYLLYSNQNLFVDAYKRSTELPTLDVSMAEESVPMIFKSTGADLVAIFEVNQILGTRNLMRMYTKNGRVKTLDGKATKIFTGHAGNDSDSIALIAGETPCGDYTTAQSIFGLYYKEVGVTYTCRISIPPERNLFIGQITVGWVEKPADIEQVRAVLNIASAASVVKR
jgi:hypothetical protein